MGYFKNKLIEERQRGYRDCDKLICSSCVDDYFLENYIETNGEVKECDYCKNENSCVSISDLMSIIIKGIRQEYEEANGNVAWESKEGGYVGATVWDNYELLYDILIDNMIVINEVAEDLKDVMIETIWCEHDPYGDRPDDEIFYSWKSFSRELIECKDTDVLSKYDVILDEVCEKIIEHDLVTNIESDTPIYRARFHGKSELIQNSKQLASPRPEIASNNRMSKCGYPMFYGSLDKDTCIVEVGEIQGLNISRGVFYNQRKIKVIDFTKLEKIPYISLFDIERYNERVSLLFLRKFNEDITKPIENCDSKQDEYIPTQVLTNYFKNSFKTESGESINGILYNSSLSAEGKCIVLFLKNEDASDKKDKILWLDNKNIETYSYDEYQDKKKLIVGKNKTNHNFKIDYNSLYKSIEEKNQEIKAYR